MDKESFYSVVKSIQKFEPNYNKVHRDDMSKTHISSVDNKVDNKKEEKEESLLAKWWFIILMIFLFWPVGLILLVRKLWK